MLKTSKPKSKSTKNKGNKNSVDYVKMMAINILYQRLRRKGRVELSPAMTVISNFHLNFFLLTSHPIDFDYYYHNDEHYERQKRKRNLSERNCFPLLCAILITQSWKARVYGRWSPSPYLDSFVIDCFLDNCPKSALIGMFDGHGGSEVSKFLCKSMPQVIRC